MKLNWNEDNTFRVTKIQLEELMYQSFKCNELADYQKHRNEVLDIDN